MVKKLFSTSLAVTVWVVLWLCVSAAEAIPVTFDFNSVGPTNDDDTISTSMTDVYGSTVTADDVEVQDNTDDPDWIGNSTKFLRSDSGADFEILFNDLPIVALLGTTRGYVFDETLGADFAILAYNSNWSASGGDIESPNPAALVDTFSVSGLSNNTEVDIPDIFFPQTVFLLVISNSGAEDVGIDDLSVTPVPEPSTIVLFGLGILGVLGYGYHRKRR
jgi:hypothetical protein